MIPKMGDLLKKGGKTKGDRVSELVEILQQDGVVSIVDTTGVPATAMLGMRSELRNRMSMTMAKKTLFRIAWKEVGFDESMLEKMMDKAEQPVLVHSSVLSPFQLFNELEKTRTGRSVKSGDIAPQDIIVEAGETDFVPGPIVGELSAVGIPAKIDKGKVMIQKTVTAVNEGEEIPVELGLMLDKLGIKPIEIGIILCGAIEGGVLMPPEDLDLDIDGFRSNIAQAVSASFNVACNVRWFTPETIPVLVSKAKSEALSVAIEAGITNSETMPLFISRANARAMAVAGQLDSSALDEDLSSMLGATATAVASAPADAAPEEAAEEVVAEDEEVEEDGSFDGLGGLFD